VGPVVAGHADEYSNNTVVLARDGAVGGGNCGAAGPTRALVERNVYISPTGKAQECGMSLAAWQAADKQHNDPGSVARAYPPDLDTAAVDWARQLLGL